MRRTSPLNIVSVVIGLVFLYVPIAILVIYSFNDSKLVSVWGGWSLRWYRALLDDSAILQAAWVSIRIAFVTACLATVLGTLAALALVRMGCFRGRLPFSAMVYAPMVMPEVIIGLALLLLFVALDIERGMITTTLAHTTLTMCFVTVIVQSRLLAFDWSLEEAAMAVARRSCDCKLHNRAGRDDLAHPDLFRGAAWREAGDQRHFHDHDCICCGRRGDRLAFDQALRGVGAGVRREGVVTASACTLRAIRAPSSRTVPGRCG